MSLDILILTNGPGEVTTWVPPVVKALREELGNNRDRLRISLVLSPCNNATGTESAIALGYEEIDRVQAAEHFFPFLLWGKTQGNWDWRDRGVIIFLGGDQFFTLVIGKRLGYKTLVYAEWDARWYRWIDAFGAMQQQVIAKVPHKYRDKFTVVGDLMLDVPLEKTNEHYRYKEDGEILIGLLPGSKAAKLAQGVPLCLAIAEELHLRQLTTKFIIPVAPTIDLEYLAKFANRQQNPVLAKVGGIEARLIPGETFSYFQTPTGLQITLETKFPAFELLKQCDLCLTTVGANTAQLGSLAVPALVLIPTQQLDAMRSWDGIPGLLANLPGMGSIFAKLINWWILKQKKLFAWPNIWAQEEIIPELVGELQAEEIALICVDFLENPHKLAKMRDSLLRLRHPTQAGQQMVRILVEKLLTH